MKRLYVPVCQLSSYKKMLPKIGCLLVLSLLCSYQLYAQSGETGLNNAITQVKGYYDNGTKLMYAIGAIVGIVGAIKVYNKWNSGDQDTGKVAASWFGSCIFLVVVTAILRGFFIG